MAKKKTKVAKPAKERSLQTVLRERIRFSGFFFPKKEEPELYKVPDPILTYYKQLYDCGDLFNNDDIEVIYTVQGELSGYYGIDRYYSNRVVTFVFFDLGQQYKDNIIFKLSMLSADLGVELPYNVTLRCVFLPCHVFYDNYISDELLKKYDQYTSDASFCSKVQTHNTDMLYKGRLVRSFDKRAVLEYDNDICVHDAIYDLRKYADCLNDKSVIDLLKPIADLSKNATFALDHLPSDNGRIERPSTDVMNTNLSYIGFNKIHFILPKASDADLTQFISTLFDGIGDPGYHGTVRDTFMKRFGFFVEESIPVNHSKDYRDPIKLTFVDNEMKRSTTRYVEISPYEVYKRYYKLKTS